MLKPLADRVVIEVAEAETKTASGIILADTSKEKPMKGKVIAAGPGAYQNGVLVPMTVKEGDMVVYSKYSGSEIKLDGQELLIVRQSDILAIVE
ncbi:MAG: co-chaperone GroES [Selenomonadales bacterium]|jgi:chaperonin GroES|nr:co-chaperone GroES [Selenomonadales bacterium]MDY3739027.1 co-chaperone GroES [Selenomonadaceae bacterium]MEE1362898.1 co-chaperone GroES [Selenomonadaceae bacterium]